MTHVVVRVILVVAGAALLFIGAEMTVGVSPPTTVTISRGG